ncbi:hypothetical protein PIB30_045586 [Stylosanthes scabra]|uniref:Uncharacterized protein n=1 Tax=Stylosanthes scabra TaxID=79078 RepID=A0ABU6ZEZ2_9FABA|nr:hypothetical protein [Stylosanthes scabra]
MSLILDIILLVRFINKMTKFMEPKKLKLCIIIFLLFFLELYPGTVNSLRITGGVDQEKLPTEVSFEMKGRKLMKVDTEDYKEYDSNHKNDQGKEGKHG